MATAMLARSLGKRGLLCPADNAAEAAVVGDIDVIPVSMLTQAVGFLNDELPIFPLMWRSRPSEDGLGKKGKGGGWRSGRRGLGVEYLARVEDVVGVQGLLD